MKRSKIVVRIGVFYYCEYSTINRRIWGVGNVEEKRKAASQNATSL